MNTETTHVVIENWANNSWLRDWIPIIIAVIALLTSISSLYWTRQEFIKNSRPYVWASNYGFVDSKQNTMVQVPYGFGFRIKNNPARIIRVDIEIKDENNTLFSFVLENMIRFPDESSEWNFSMGEVKFKEIMDHLPDVEKKKVRRIIEIEYSALDGGKKYKYKLEQTFEPLENQWKDEKESAE